LANKPASERHTPAFKAAAVARFAAGESVSGVAKDIGVLRQELQRWLAAERPRAAALPAPPSRQATDQQTGIRKRDGNYTDAFKWIVLEWASGDITLAALATEVGVHRDRWRSEAAEPRKKRDIAMPWRIIESLKRLDHERIVVRADEPDPNRGKS
jgi:transposase-like protein